MFIASPLSAFHLSSASDPDELLLESLDADLLCASDDLLLVVLALRSRRGDCSSSEDSCVMTGGGIDDDDTGDPSLFFVRKPALNRVLV